MGVEEQHQPSLESSVLLARSSGVCLKDHLYPRPQVAALTHTCVSRTEAIKEVKWDKSVKETSVIFFGSLDSSDSEKRVWVCGCVWVHA